MKLVLEKDFIHTLAFINNKTEIQSDIEKFLKDDFNGYELLCDIESHDEYKKLCSENPFFEFLLDKFVNIKYNVNVKEEIKNKNLINNETKRTIFFTSLDSELSNNLTKKYGQFFISAADIDSTWEFPYKMRKGMKMKVTQSTLINPEDKIDSWDKVNKFHHPFRSAIIFDKFLLKTHSPGELEINVIPLIKNLTPKQKESYYIHITIISEIKTGFKLNQYLQKLTKSFEDNIKFNIIRHSKALYPNNLEGLHARFILTDYISIIPDHSFTFFKKNGAVNAVTNVSADFTMCRKNRNFYEKDCADLQLYLAKVNNEPNGDEKFSDMYNPHKNNPLLN